MTDIDELIKTLRRIPSLYFPQTGDERPIIEALILLLKDLKARKSGE
jgi:hypothetical protein